MDANCYYDTGRRPMRAAFDPKSRIHRGQGGRAGPPRRTAGGRDLSPRYVILQWLRDLRQRLPLPSNYVPR